MPATGLQHTGSKLNACHWTLVIVDPNEKQLPYLNPLVESEGYFPKSNPIFITMTCLYIMLIMLCMSWSECMLNKLV